MNSVVYTPERWGELLAAAKKERHRLGLDKNVVLSHNFTHHLEIADDFVARMSPPRRKALARYIRGLDALSLSQYMDLTVGLPAADRGKRLPSADEIAQALVAHEKNFRDDILGTALGLKPKADPAAAHRRVRHRARRPAAPQPLGRRRDRPPRRRSSPARSRAVTKASSATSRSPRAAPSRAPSSGSPAPTTTCSAGRTPKYGNPEAAAAIQGALHAPRPPSTTARRCERKEPGRVGAQAPLAL